VLSASASDSAVKILSTVATIRGSQQHASDFERQEEESADGNIDEQPKVGPIYWGTVRASNNGWVMDISNSYTLLGRDTQKHINKLCLSHTGKNRRFFFRIKVLHNETSHEPCCIPETPPIPRDSWSRCFKARHVLLTERLRNKGTWFDSLIVKDRYPRMQPIVDIIKLI